MNTAQVSIEHILAGILALCAFVLPFWQGGNISQDLLQTDAFIGVLGIAYLLGVVFDKLADTLLSPMEHYLRLRQANKILERETDFKPRNAFPQNKLEFKLREANDGRLEWMNSLRSRIRTSREVAVLGLPASMGIVIYGGVTKDCAADGSQACIPQWIYIFVILNLFCFMAAVWREMKAEDEKTTDLDNRRIRTEDLEHDPTNRRIQMEKARKQMRTDSLAYFLLILNSAAAIVAVATIRPANSWIAPFGMGGLIISLLSLWACLRITRTYMSFVGRASAELK